MNKSKSPRLGMGVVGLTAVLVLWMQAAMAVAYTTSATTLLYDGSLNTGTPNTQAMLYASLPFANFQTFSNGVTTLDTTGDDKIYAGYLVGHQSVSILDRTQGYTLHFTVQIDRESHIKSHRAGFSVIVLSDDLKGIELGFWQDEIWAQHDDSTGDLFTHAEGVAFDTTTGLIAYALTVIGDIYTLSVDQAAILTGPLRDYSSATGAIDPYETPNFIFLGDDTTSAQAAIRLTYIAVAVNVPVVVEDIVNAARLDIGMPYHINRGCPSPAMDCSGPFHGFYAGVCTDLLLDAYRAGAGFNLQQALSQDARAHPGRYRYGTARYADDLRRYFKYHQQLVDPSQPFQLGDMAFFDWHGDGVTDYVNIISAVDDQGAPLKVVEATGLVAGHPSGLAIEHDWSSAYHQYSQGHAQLIDLIAGLAPFPEASEPLQMLRITIDTPAVTLYLSDTNGKSVSETYDENLVASNVDAFIPYIPRGRYSRTETDRLITVMQPLSNTSQYFLRLQGLANATYNMTIETLDNHEVYSTERLTETIEQGESKGTSIVLHDDTDGRLGFSIASLMASPHVSVPDLLSMSIPLGTSGQLTFDVAEMGGRQSIHQVSIEVTDLTDQLGGLIPAGEWSITPSHFNVSLHESQRITAQMNTERFAVGVYQGGFVIASQNAGTFRIPFTLEIQPMP